MPFRVEGKGEGSNAFQLLDLTPLILPFALGEKASGALLQNAPKWLPFSYNVKIDFEIGTKK
jgi:hypothetical protein